MTLKKMNIFLLLGIMFIVLFNFVYPSNNSIIEVRKIDNYIGNFTPQENYDLSTTNSIDPTKWVAVDNLGRTIAVNGETYNSKTIGNVNNGLQVGLFYHNWHNVVRHCTAKPMSIPERKNYIINRGQDPLLFSSWANSGSVGSLWWAEPVYGYYNPKDKYVIRKQIELISDAGVDFLVLDYTNYNEIGNNSCEPYTNDLTNSVFPDELNLLFDVLDEAQADGIKTPKVTFMLSHLACDRDLNRQNNCSVIGESTEDSIKHNEETKKIVQWLYRMVYNNSSRQKHLLYGGQMNPSYMSPIILAQHPSPTTYQLDSGYEALNYAHWRYMGNQYENVPYNTSGFDWSWIDKYPQTKYMYNTSSGTTNEIAVSPAQHTDADPNHGAIAFSFADTYGTPLLGRSNAVDDNYSYSFKYRNNTYNVGKNFQLTPGIGVGTLFGRNFQQQWDYAISTNPEFVFVTGWNEYLAGSFSDDNGKIMFVDQYNDEFSRDIEPVKGSLKDSYYYQLVSNVRRYKGANSQASQQTSKTINIYGDPNQWHDSNLLDYNSYTNNTSPGRDVNNMEWGYNNNKRLSAVKAKNDIRTTKVSYDASNIYFYVETVDKITDISKLRLLIDTLDSKTSTSTSNWNEFEYVLNRNGLSSSTLKLEKVTKGCRNDSLPSEEGSSSCEWTKVGDVNYQIVNNTMQVSIPRRFLNLTNLNINFNYKWADNNLENLTKVFDIMSVYTDGDAAPGGRFAYKFTGNKTYEEPKEYTITYNSNGGTGTVLSQSGELNTKVILNSNSFVKNYNTFKKWNTKADGTGVSYDENQTILITENMTLYAIWAVDDITFNNKTVTSTYNKTSVQIIKNGIDEATNGSGTYTYAITAGNTKNYFSLSGRNILVAANTPANTTGYSITITATDSNTGATKVAIYTIKVNTTKPTNTHVAYTTHVQYVGWQDYVSDGKMAGTSGRSLRLEGIKIKLENQKYDGNVRYRTHIQNIGWEKDFKKNNEMSGTEGRSYRLEAIEIKLDGAMEENYDIYYRVHAENFGWLGWAKNGESAGTAGYAYRLEGIEIQLVEKGTAFPGYGDKVAFKDKSEAEKNKLISYTTHVQYVGWQDYVSDGAMAGTSGRSLRLEGIKIKLENQKYDGNVRYRTHIQNIGWEKDFKKNNEMSGTSGRSYRLEAIQIKLDGGMKDYYDIYYRVHAENFGWLGWAKNGESAGTAGYAYRLEGIEIVVVEKGNTPPKRTDTQTKEAFKQNK